MSKLPRAPTTAWVVEIGKPHRVAVPTQIVAPVDAHIMPCKQGRSVGRGGVIGCGIHAGGGGTTPAAAVSMGMWAQRRPQ